MLLGNKLGSKLDSYSQDTSKKQENAKGPTELTTRQVDKVKGHGSFSFPFKQERAELSMLPGRAESRGYAPMLWGLSAEPQCLRPLPLLQEQRPRQAEHSWLGTPGRAGTGPPGSPVVPVLQTKLLNPELGHLSVLPFFLHFHGFMDPQQECWSQDIPVQTSTGITTPPAVSEHTLGHQAAGCTTTSISIGSYTE